MAVDKLVDSTQLNSDLTSIANAIRTKGNTIAELAFPQGFVQAINNISAAGSITVESLTITENGTYTAEEGTAYSPVTVAVVPQAVERTIFFRDYDGTLLYSYSENEFNALQDLPPNPTHEGLISQGWNWTRQEILSQIQAVPGGDITIGQQYDTIEGGIRIYCDLAEDTLNIGIGFNTSGGGLVTIDWGDNSSQNFNCGTSAVTQSFSHTYSVKGSYIINIIPSTNVSFGLISKNSCSGLIQMSSPPYSGFISYRYLNIITRIEIGSHVTSINSNSLSSLRNLKYITLPSSLGLHAQYLFNLDVSLPFVVVPRSTMYLSSNSFQGCSNLLGISLPAQNFDHIDNYCFGECYSLKSITFPYSLSSLSPYCFVDCYSLKTIKLPPSITLLQQYAFQNCHSLNSVYLPSTLTEIQSAVFYYCYSLNTINWPSSLTTLNSSAFRSCVGLTGVLDLPSSITTIGTYCFQETNYRQIELPEKLTVISKNTFYGNRTLESINIPQGVTAIESGAFYGCYGLSVATIPETVTRIESTAFQNCTNVQEYHFLSTTPPTLGSTTTLGTNTKTIIYVPYSEDHSVLEAYKTATNWSTYASKIQEEPQS